MDKQAILNILEKYGVTDMLEKKQLNQLANDILTAQEGENIELQHLRDIKQMVVQLQVFQDQRYETIFKILTAQQEGIENK